MKPESNNTKASDAKPSDSPGAVDPKSKSSTPKQKKLLIGLLAVLVIGAGIYLYISNSGEDSSTNTFLIPGQSSTSHGGITFLKPSNFEAVKNNIPSTKLTSGTIVDYSDSTKSTSLASVFSTTYAGNMLFGKTQAETEALISKPQSPDYAQYIDALSKYINDVAYPTQTIRVTSLVSAFTNPNITKGAYKADFIVLTTDNSKGFNSSEKFGDGKIFIAFGKSSTYVLVETSNWDNWQKNTKTWKDILDSIKIDQ